MTIKIQQLNKHFGQFHALKDINLSFPENQLTALLGPSGCGKTTLLRIIAGLEFADNGHIWFGEKEVTQLSAAERGVGFVFQHYALFQNMTVFDNVAFGLTVKPRRERPSAEEIREKVTALLKLVKLEWLADRYPNQLSGGQKQRIALARSLAVQPKVLLLDEPFGALDALTRAKLQDELQEIVARTQSTVVMVTHDVDEAVLLSDKIVMMTNGPAATIGEVLPVPLPRPRDRVTLAENADYQRCRKAVIDFLYARQKHVEKAA